MDRALLLAASGPTSESAIGASSLSVDGTPPCDESSRHTVVGRCITPTVVVGGFDATCAAAHGKGHPHPPRCGVGLGLLAVGTTTESPKKDQCRVGVVQAVRISVYPIFALRAPNAFSLHRPDITSGSIACGRFVFVQWVYPCMIYLLQDSYSTNIW